MEQMATQKPRVSVSLDKEVYEWLEERAKREVRTISNLVEFFVVREMQSEKSEKKN